MPPYVVQHRVRALDCESRKKEKTAKAEEEN